MLAVIIDLGLQRRLVPGLGRCDRLLLFILLFHDTTWAQRIHYTGVARLLILFNLMWHILRNFSQFLLQSVELVILASFVIIDHGSVKIILFLIIGTIPLILVCNNL